MAHIDILSRSRFVDELVSERFRKKCLEAKVHRPDDLKITDTSIFIDYAPQEIDGRIFAAKFLDYASLHGVQLSIARPPELDDPKMTIMSFSNMEESELMKPKSYRPANMTDMISYSIGELRFISPDGKTHFNGLGMLPITTSITICTAVQHELQDGLVFYRGFERKLFGMD
jgi:hypothetical protein